MPLDCPAEPWLSFLTELDAQLDAPVDFHCIGGFVVSQHYGLGRETADLDVLAPKQSHQRRLRLRILGVRLARLAARVQRIRLVHDAVNGQIIVIRPFRARRAQRQQQPQQDAEKRVGPAQVGQPVPN